MSDTRFEKVSYIDFIIIKDNKTNYYNLTNFDKNTYKNLKKYFNLERTKKMIDSIFENCYNDLYFDSLRDEHVVYYKIDSDIYVHDYILQDYLNYNNTLYSLLNYKNNYISLSSKSIFVLDNCYESDKDKIDANMF